PTWKRYPWSSNEEIKRCVVVRESPVTRTMSVKDRAPPSTASITAAARSRTPTGVSGREDGAERFPSSTFRRSIISSARRVSASARCASGFLGKRAILLVPDIGTQFHYMEQPLGRSRGRRAGGSRRSRHDAPDARGEGV